MRYRNVGNRDIFVHSDYDSSHVGLRDNIVFVEEEADWGSLRADLVEHLHQRYITKSLAWL